MLIHGMRRSPEYCSWSAMKSRCYKRSDVAFARYGGAGITVCDRWRNSFQAFYADMGPRPAGMTLDRVERARGYEPSNTRWATDKQQIRNRRNTVRVLTATGVQYLADFAKPLGLSYGAAFMRLRRGTLPGATEVSE